MKSEPLTEEQIQSLLTAFADKTPSLMAAARKAGIEGEYPEVLARLTASGWHVGRILVPYRYQDRGYVRSYFDYGELATIQGELSRGVPLLRIAKRRDLDRWELHLKLRRSGYEMRRTLLPIIVKGLREVTG